MTAPVSASLEKLLCQLVDEPCWLSHRNFSARPFSVQDMTGCWPRISAAVSIPLIRAPTLRGQVQAPCMLWLSSRPRAHAAAGYLSSSASCLLTHRSCCCQCYFDVTQAGSDPVPVSFSCNCSLDTDLEIISTQSTE